MGKVTTVREHEPLDRAADTSLDCLQLSQGAVLVVESLDEQDGTMDL